MDTAAKILRAATKAACEASTPAPRVTHLVRLPGEAAGVGEVALVCLLRLPVAPYRQVLHITRWNNRQKYVKETVYTHCTGIRLCHHHNCLTLQSCKPPVFVQNARVAVFDQILVGTMASKPHYRTTTYQQSPWVNFLRVVDHHAQHDIPLLDVLNGVGAGHHLPEMESAKQLHRGKEPQHLCVQMEGSSIHHISVTSRPYNRRKIDQQPKSRKNTSRAHTFATHHKLSREPTFALLVLPLLVEKLFAITSRM
jgi:hypothetical protein